VQPGQLLREKETLHKLPTIEVEISRLDSGIGVLDLFVEAGLAPSKSEARRLVKQSGASVNGRKIENEMQTLTSSDLIDGALMLKAGKKRVARIVPKL